MQLVVKAANVRLQAAHAMLAYYRNPVRCPLRPALWEGRLRATEDRWRATLAGRGLMARLAPAAAADGPRAQRDPALNAFRMRQPPPRPAPAQRAAARADHAARRQPLHDDTVDPVDVAERPPAWADVYTAIYVFL